MHPHQRQSFDAVRDIAAQPFAAGCYAPFTSLHFDTRGLVHACCLNVMHTLGNVAVDSLDDIWRGPRIEALRAAMREYDFSLGCHHCQWHLDRDAARSVYALKYDRFMVAEAASNRWPQMMEFQISNTCNLECVQCRGEWSALVRKNREKLPPLPSAYGPNFFQQVRPYLPHLRQAQFLGGEPFLARETLEIWDMMLADGLTTPCAVTTNGTIYNARVERILEALPVTVIVSLDGATRETIESIRLNARFDRLMENVARFREYTRRRETGFALTYCLMRQNWHEFGEFLLLADQLDAETYVNVVFDPREHSLYQLPRVELADVVRKLEAQSPRLEAQLTRNRAVWQAELERLRQAATGGESNAGNYVTASLLGRLAEARPAPRADADARHLEARRRVEQLAHTAAIDALVCDRDDVAQALAVGDPEFLGLSRAAVVGRPITEIVTLLRERWGTDMRLAECQEQPDGVYRRLEFRAPDQSSVTVHMLSAPNYDAEGVLLGSTTYAARQASS